MELVTHYQEKVNQLITELGIHAAEFKAQAIEIDEEILNKLRLLSPDGVELVQPECLQFKYIVFLGPGNLLVFTDLNNANLDLLNKSDARKVNNFMVAATDLGKHVLNNYLSSLPAEQGLDHIPEINVTAVIPRFSRESIPNTMAGMILSEYLRQVTGKLIVLWPALDVRYLRTSLANMIVTIVCLRYGVSYASHPHIQSLLQGENSLPYISQFDFSPEIVENWYHSLIDLSIKSGAVLENGKNPYAGPHWQEG